MTVRALGAALLATTFLLTGGCHLIFPFDGQPATPADDAAEQAIDALVIDAPDSIDGLTAPDQGLDLPRDVSGVDAPLLVDSLAETDAPSADVAMPEIGPSDSITPDTLSSMDLPWPADTAMPDLTPSPDLPWTADSMPTPDATPPATGEVLWAQGFGDTSLDQGSGVAVDQSGNIYLTGSFNGTVDFGCAPALTSAGGRDIVLASYTPAGSCRWAQRFGGPALDRGLAVTVDLSGNLSIAGGFSSASVDFGGSPLNNTDTSGLTFDLFVASFDSTGGWRWARAAGDPATSDEGYAITADPAGNVTVTGTFGGTMDPGCGNLKANGSANDIVVASFDSAGSCRWQANYGTPTEDDNGRAVACDESGNLYVAGYLGGSASLGGPQLPGYGGWDLFLASYTSAGSYRWAKNFGGTGSDSGFGVAVDATGNVFVTGWFEDSVDFGGGPLSTAVNRDVFFASYTASSGSYRWADNLGGTGEAAGFAVAVDPSGNAFFTGEMQGTASFGGTTLVSAGGDDILVFSTTATGAPRWAKRLGGTWSDSGRGAAISSAGLVITGWFASIPLDMGVTVLSSAGSNDILLATLAP